MNLYNRLPDVPVLDGRQPFLIEQCKGKRVLHLGCVDTGLLQERFQTGELLHQKLLPVAGELWGLDINAEGIAFLQEQGIEKLLVGDVCALNEVEALRGHKFDIILASEVVEHLQNPGLFLRTVQALMLPGITELIISVPNAFRLSTLLMLLNGVELVHPDHNYWFSYHTIRNLIEKEALNITQVYVYAFPSNRFSWRRASRRLLNDREKTPEGACAEGESQERTLRGILGHVRALPKWILAAVLLRKTPFFGDGLIVVCRVPEPNE